MSSCVFLLLLLLLHPVQADFWQSVKDFLAKISGRSGEARTTTQAADEEIWRLATVHPPQRIYKGWEARPWPHHVGLCVDKNVICGGTMIDKHWVLTAAHCIKNNLKDPESEVGRLRVKLGAHQLRDDSCIENKGPEQLRAVERVHVHPRFKQPLASSNDVALLRLQKPADYGLHALPIKLPLRIAPILPSEICFVMGWGLTETGYRSDVLMETELKILSHSDCLRLHSTTRVDHTMFCAGNIGKPGPNTCEGDSGGAMVCQKDKDWYLAGVASWGYRCYENNSTGVYANMDRLLGFLNEVMQPDYGITRLKVVTGAEPDVDCPLGYYRLPQNLQGVRGATRYVYLCYKRQKRPRHPITALSISVGHSDGPSCPKSSAGFVGIPQRRKNGLHESTVYICFQRGDGEPLVDIIAIRRLWKFEEEEDPAGFELVCPPVAFDYEQIIFLAIRTKAIPAHPKRKRISLKFRGK